jgi:HlyD family secretion protein
VVTYPVVIEVPNPELDKLRVGSTANVSFQIDVRENVTRIPMAALRFVPPDHLIKPEDKKYVEVKKKDPKEGEEKLSAERRASRPRSGPSGSSGWPTGSRSRPSRSPSGYRTGSTPN